MSAPDFTARALALKALESGALSAYDIAVEHGFEGDEADWLASLVGPAGADGADGEDGAPGAPGSDGEDGADGAPGSDGADGFGSGLGDPGADRLLGWDESAGAAAFFETGVGLAIAGTALDVAGWTLLDSFTVSAPGATEIAFTGIPAWPQDLLLLAHGIQFGESNGIQLRIYDGSGWSGAFGLASLGATSDCYVTAQIVARHLDRGIIVARAASSALSSPGIGGAASPSHAPWRADGGIDGISIKLGTGDFEAGNFHLYGRA